MNDQIKKTVMLRARLRSVDRDLLEAVCSRRGWNLSEGVRQAIRDEAEKEGLYDILGLVLKRDVKVQNGQSQQP